MPHHSFVIEPAHPSLPGHFPGRPVVPGVVLLDRVLELLEMQNPELVGQPVRLPQVKFLQPLLPGEAAAIELESVSTSGSARWKFRILRNGALLASGEIVQDAAS